MNKKLKCFGYLFFLAVAFSISIGYAVAVANFQVSSFSCSPSEAAINSVFSCTAQVQNVGDTAGSVSTATLYPDSSDWLENSNYPQSSGSSVNPGQSTEITFGGLRAVKSGNNGFSKIMLDSVTDTYVSDQNKMVNIINVLVSVNNSVSSAAIGEEVTSTTEITAGGNVDVELTFAVSSGGCSIGSQTNPKTISGMTDGSKQSRTWTITMGSANCVYSMSAAATGTGGIASKIDISSNTLTCTDCPVDSGSDLGGGGGGGSGSGGGTDSYTLGELEGDKMQTLGNGEKVRFKINGEEHNITVLNLTTTRVKIEVASSPQIFEMIVGQEIKVDLNGDNSADVSIKLQSINTLLKKATFIFAKTAGAVTAGLDSNNADGEANVSDNAGKDDINNSSSLIWIWIVIALVIVAIFAIGFRSYRKLRRYHKGY